MIRLKRLLHSLHWVDVCGIIAVGVAFYGVLEGSWLLVGMVAFIMLLDNRTYLRRIEKQLSDTRRIEEQVRDLAKLLREKTCEHLFTIRADGKTRCQNCETEV